MNMVQKLKKKNSRYDLNWSCVLEIVDRISIHIAIVRKYQSLKQTSFNYFLY